MSEAELQALVRSIEELRESQRESHRETYRAIKDLAGVFATQWGKLVEALVEPGCVDQFRERGINITRSFQRAEGIDGEGRQMEVDVLLVDGNEVVAIEVKTNLKTNDVDEHEERLERFKSAFPEYREKTIFGAVAALSFESGTDKYACRRGLFVLRPEKGLTRIANDRSFQPKRF